VKLAPDHESLTALLDGRQVPYRLVRVQRRSIGFVIDDSGLTVRAPARVSRRAIAEALAEKSGWILRTLDKWARRERASLPREEWRDGGSVLYRGELLTLIVEQARQNRVEHDFFSLRVRLRETGGDHVAHAVQRWLEMQARSVLRERLDQYSSALELPPPVAKFTRARTQWGSCNAQGAIRLHWRLIQLPAALADYIVAHEVAHRIELNHSARFWATVEQVFPAWRQARKELEAYGELLG
jgi:predicted metal-dependent hydrolase